MGINLKDLALHIKSKDETFDFKKGVEYVYNGKTNVAQSYTLTKLNTQTERKLVALYTGDNKKRTIIDILSYAVIKINNMETSNNEIVTLLNHLEKKELELLFYNLRIMNYGDELRYNYSCTGNVIKRSPNGRVERDSDGSPILVECGHRNEVLISLDPSEVLVGTEEEEEEEKEEDMPYLSLGDYVEIDIDVKVYIQKVLGKEIDSVMYRKIPKKLRDKYEYLIDFILVVNRIEINTDDDMEIVKIRLNDFFNVKGEFSISSMKVREFIDFYNNILPLALVKDARNKSISLTNDESYIKIDFEHECKACKHLNKGEVGVYHPDFLLPTKGR